MGLKWYPHPEDVHCIKGCEVRHTDTRPHPVRSLLCLQHSCLDLNLQRPKKRNEDYEDVEELYAKVSTCDRDVMMMSSNEPLSLCLFFLCARRRHTRFHTHAPTRLLSCRHMSVRNNTLIV